MGPPPRHLTCTTFHDEMLRISVKQRQTVVCSNSLGMRRDPMLL